MKQNKKAQGLTLNTVVIAVLVLIVLAILIFIAYKYIWGTGTGIGELADCQARADGKGYCSDNCGDDESAFYHMGGCNENSEDSNKRGTYCCIPHDS